MHQYKQYVNCLLKHNQLAVIPSISYLQSTTALKILHPISYSCKMIRTVT